MHIIMHDPPRSVCDSVFVEHEEPNDGPGNLASLGEGDIEITSMAGGVSTELSDGVSKSIQQRAHLFYFVDEARVTLPNQHK